MSTTVLLAAIFGPMYQFASKNFSCFRSATSKARQAKVDRAATAIVEGLVVEQPEMASAAVDAAGEGSEAGEEMGEEPEGPGTRGRTVDTATKEREIDHSNSDSDGEQVSSDDHDEGEEDGFAPISESDGGSELDLDHDELLSPAPSPGSGIGDTGGGGSGAPGPAGASAAGSSLLPGLGAPASSSRVVPSSKKRVRGRAAGGKGRKKVKVRAPYKRVKAVNSVRGASCLAKLVLNLYLTGAEFEKHSVVCRIRFTRQHVHDHGEHTEVGGVLDKKSIRTLPLVATRRYIDEVRALAGGTRLPLAASRVQTRMGGRGPAG
jgi:hypothetical protein